MVRLMMVAVEQEEVEGHFVSRKKRAVKSTKVNMAEGPSTTANPSNQFVVKCSVRGHHVYKRIWSPSIGEPFETFCEEENEHNKYAMAVHRNTIVGHIPREITHTCHFFVKNERQITCEVSGRQQCCTAACGGVEVPCLLMFYQDTRVLGKAKELVTNTFVLA